MFAIPVAARAQPRAHRRLGLALIVVATLLTFIGLFAIWANRQLLNTDNWTDSSSKLLENDDIRSQLSIFLVDELYKNVDVQARLRQALPPRLDPLAGPAAGGLRQFAERAVNQLLERPRAQKAWEQASRRAHQRFLDVVEGGGPAVSTGGGDVTLDLKGLLGQTESRVGIGGRAAEKVPADAAQLEILHSDQLELAQDLVHFLKILAIGLVVVAIGLFALAVYLARGWRREALRAVGIGFVVAGAGALLVRGLAGNVVVDSLAKTESVRPAIDAAWTIATSLLSQAAVAALAYGVVIVFAAWLAGPTRAATGTRGALAPWIQEPRIAYGALAVIVLLVVAWGPTPATRRPLAVLLMIGLLVLGMEVLRRQTAREYPDASREESIERLRARLSGLRRRPAARAGDHVEQLERLGRLRDQGVIDAGEFEREKARILAQPTAG